jgi:1,4-dihydroxy-2-naphthoate polyprenyltransferase
MSYSVASDRTPGLAVRLRALRAFSFPLTALPVLIAVGAVLPASQWRWDVLAISLAAAVLLHAAGNLLNDYFDFRSGVDRKIDGDEGRPGRVLVRGELAPADVLREAGLCLLLVLAATAYLLWRCQVGLLWFAAAGLVGLYAYTGPPFHLKYRSLGEPLIFVVFGPLLMLGAAYAQTGELEWPVLLLCWPIGLFTTAVLLGNNIRDRDEDRAAGVRTLADRLGRRACSTYAACVLLPPVIAGALGFTGTVPVGAALALVSLIPAALLVRRVLAEPRLPDIDARTARCATIFMLLMWFGVIATQQPA